MSSKLPINNQIPRINKQNGFNFSNDMPPITRQIAFNNDFPNSSYIAQINLYEDVDLDNENLFRSTPMLNSLDNNTDKNFDEKPDEKSSENKNISNNETNKKES